MNVVRSKDKVVPPGVIVNVTSLAFMGPYVNTDTLGSSSTGMTYNPRKFTALQTRIRTTGSPYNQDRTSIIIAATAYRKSQEFSGRKQFDQIVDDRISAAVTDRRRSSTTAAAAAGKRGRSARRRRTDRSSSSKRRRRSGTSDPDTRPAVIPALPASIERERQANSKFFRQVVERDMVIEDEEDRLRRWRDNLVRHREWRRDRMDPRRFDRWHRQYLLDQYDKIGRSQSSAAAAAATTTVEGDEEDHLRRIIKSMSNEALIFCKLLDIMMMPHDVTVLFYHTAKSVHTGAPHELMSRNAAWSVSRILKGYGIPARMRDFQIQNIVSNFRAGFEVCLECFGRHYQDRCDYQPERFPAVMYRTTTSKIVALVNYTGCVVVTGTKSRSEAQDFFADIYYKLREFKKRDHANSRHYRRYGSCRLDLIRPMVDEDLDRSDDDGDCKRPGRRSRSKRRDLACVDPVVRTAPSDPFDDDDDPHPSSSPSVPPPPPPTWSTRDLHDRYLIEKANQQFVQQAIDFNDRICIETDMSDHRTRRSDASVRDRMATSRSDSIRESVTRTVHGESTAPDPPPSSPPTPKRRSTTKQIETITVEQGVTEIEQTDERVRDRLTEMEIEDRTRSVVDIHNILTGRDQIESSSSSSSSSPLSILDLTASLAVPSTDTSTADPASTIVARPDPGSATMTGAVAASAETKVDHPLLWSVVNACIRYKDLGEKLARDGMMPDHIRQRQLPPLFDNATVYTTAQCLTDYYTQKQ